MRIYKINMPTPEPLGELEQLVLLAIMRLGPECYGVPIVAELQKHATRTILRPSVYLALRRLEEKGLIRGHMGEPESRRGGRARRHFEVTAAGRHAVQAAQRTLSRLWDGVALGKYKP